MLERHRLLPRTTVALALVAAGACTCGGEKSASGDWKTLFDTLIKGLPAASTDVPSEVIPRSLAWIATSPDPEAWRAWAVQQPFTQGLMKTPAFEDVLMSRTYLAIDGMRRTVARAAAITGDPDDAHALWRGATAIGVVDPGDPSPAFVVAKRIDPALRAVVRMAAAFASTKDATETEVGAIKVRTLDYSGRTISFAVFKNLLILGSDTALVTRAAALAQGSPRDGDVPASKDPLLPAADAEGIHVRVDLSGGEWASLVALDAVGVSLVMSPTAPLVLRRGGELPATEGLLCLLAYAPASTTFAVVDGGKPDALVSGVIERVAEQLAEEAERAAPARKKGKQKKPIVFEAARLSEALKPGVALVFGVRDDAADPGALGPAVIFAHANKDAVEAQAKALITRLTGEDAARTVLEDQGGASLFTADEAKVSAGVTKDALVLALSADAVRRALAAGAGKAPSVRDRARIGANVAASGGVFVDLPKTAAWLDAFYGASFASDEAVAQADAQAVLGPTFAAIGAGPTLFTALAPASAAVSQGALEVVP